MNETDAHRWQRPRAQKRRWSSASIRSVAAQSEGHSVADESAAHDAPMPRVVFVLGGPGSGKGTQCARLLRECSSLAATAAHSEQQLPLIPHVSSVCAGELLRDAATRDETIRNTIDRGNIVPGHVTIGLLRNALQNVAAAASSCDSTAPLQSLPAVVLLDGFPRALDQALAFESALGTPELALFFECPQEEMRARLTSRGTTSGRADDEEGVIQRRLRTFVDTSMPVVDMYQTRGSLRRIDATGSQQQVYERFVHTLVHAGVLPQQLFASPTASVSSSGGTCS